MSGSMNTATSPSVPLNDPIRADKASDDRRARDAEQLGPGEHQSGDGDAHGHEGGQQAGKHPAEV